MKKGYSLVEFLIAIVLSFFILNLLISGFSKVKLNKEYNASQDLISSLQIFNVLNVSVDVEVLDQNINFKYLNEERQLRFVNNKIIISPGTNIYYLKVDDCLFYQTDNKIYLKILRDSRESIFLIGMI